MTRHWIGCLAAFCMGVTACNHGGAKDGCTECEACWHDECCTEVCDEWDFNTYFKEQYADMTPSMSFQGSSEKDFLRWQKELRAEIRDRIGLSLIESKYGNFKPVARQLDSEDIGFAIRQRWEIMTEPGMRLPMIILLPKDLEGKAPLFLAPHGHSPNPELGAGIYHDENDRYKAEEGERNVGIQAVQHGFVTIVPTTRGFGSTRWPKDIEKGNKSSCYELMKRDLLVGRTPIGDRVWDMMKLIDWALENLPVNGTDIVISGNSGGGTMTLFTGAMDTRVTASLPASAFCTFTGSIGSLSHCGCNYIPGILSVCEMADIAGLTAPRPFCAIHGVEDGIFPIGETRKAFASLKQIYKAAGAEDMCELYEGPEGHRYYKAGAWDFIARHMDIR